MKLLNVISILLTNWCIVIDGTSKPNIILLVADDLGWNDVGFHGSDEIPTPNIDALAYHGTILNRHYTQPVCTPSRVALMTGKYPMRMGFQGGPLRNAMPVCLPLKETILPQYLKRRGYATSLVGKWHLGFYKKECTPNERGFDSFFGFYTGTVRYNDSSAAMGPDGMDARDNFERAGNRFIGKYATDVYADEAIRVIRHRNKSKPLFLEVAFSAVHAIKGGKMQLRNVTENEMRFAYIKDSNRRMFAGVVTVLDESVGKIIRALEDEDLLKNSIIAFVSDNGAESEAGPFQNYGSNWPLRGKKATVLEGGVRGVAAIWNPNGLQNVVLTNYMHLTDWLPSFYAAAGGEPLTDLDGVNQWDYLSGATDKPPRNQILINIDEKTGTAALISEGWKLVRSKNETVKYGSFKGHVSNVTYKMSEVLASPTHIALSKYDKKPLDENDFLVARKQADIERLCRLRLSQSEEEINRRRPSCFETGCLFHLENDPCEFTDMSESEINRMTRLRETLSAYERQLVKQWQGQPDPKAKPEYFKNYWSPWVEK